MPRRVIYRPEFDEDCELLGGIGAVQQVIAPLVQSLEEGDPNGFGYLVMPDGVRFVGIKAIGTMPRLIVTFRVDEDDDVIMLSVSAY
jgi:hypothetical protein